MDKNRIRGIRRRTSGPVTAKSLSIKGVGCKSGGGALKAVELTSGDLLFVRDSGLGVEQSASIGRQKSAEGIVVTRVAKARTVIGVVVRDSHAGHAPANPRSRSLPGADRVKPERNPGAVKPVSGGTRRTSSLHGLKSRNRRIRTRMYGGVGGVGPQGLPLSRSCRNEEGNRCLPPCRYRIA